MSDYYGDVVIPDMLATPEQYAAWSGTDGPATIGLILEGCTVLVLDACEGAYYDVDPTTGLATDPLIAAAMQKATCIQAGAWITLGINPLAGGVVQASVATSKKIGSASISYDTADTAAASAAKAAAATSLVPNALKVLQQVDLLGTDTWWFG